MRVNRYIHDIDSRIHVIGKKKACPPRAYYLTSVQPITFTGIEFNYQYYKQKRVSTFFCIDRIISNGNFPHSYGPCNLPVDGDAGLVNQQEQQITVVFQDFDHIADP